MLLKNLILKYLLTFIVTLSFLLVSCSNDDDASPSVAASKFVGEWKIIGIFKNGKNIMAPNVDEWSESSISFTDSRGAKDPSFEGDGMYYATHHIAYDDEEYTTIEAGIWKVNSSNIIRMNDEYDLKIKKITDTVLEFEFEEEELGMLEVRSVRAD